MNNLLMIGILVLLFELIICIFIYKNTKNKIASNLKVAIINNETERLKLYMNHDFEKIDSRIDKYIDDAGKLYKMNNFEYQDIDKLYLTEDMMTKMSRVMVKDVLKKITPAIMDLLKLSYNLDTEEDLISFLYEKIKLYVLSYSLETNADIED